MNSNSHFEINRALTPILALKIKYKVTIFGERRSLKKTIGWTN
jgi:hypothetical protein